MIEQTWKIIRTLIKNEYVWLIAIVILGLVLGLYGLGSKSFWTDEVYSILFSRGTLGSLFAQVAADVHPPFYYILLHYWIGIFGESGFWLRILSIIPFVLSIWVIYKVAELLFERKVALLGALLCAFSPILILYSRMVRYYSLTALLMLLSIYILLKIWKKDNWLPWVIYAITGTFIIYTDYPSYIYLLLSQTLLILFVFRKSFWDKLKKFIGCHLLICLLYLPWLMIFIRTTARTMGTEGVNIGMGLTVYLIKVFFPLYSFTFGETLFPWHYFLIAGGFFVFSVAIWKGLAEGWALKREEVVMVAIFSLVVILLNAFLLSVFAHTHSFIYYPRTILFSAYFYLLFVAFGLSKFSTNIRVLLLAVIITVNLVSINNIYGLKEYFNPFYIIPWNEAATFIGGELKEGDVIYQDDPALGYYLERLKAGIKPEVISEEIDPKLGDILTGKKYSRVWLVVSAKDRRNNMDYAWLKSELGKQRKLINQKNFVFLDPKYIELKEKIQKQKSYKTKLSVYLFQ